MSPPTFRFAPSPNGRLHLGHAFSALVNADLAGKAGGRLLIRLEDIDTLRCRPEYEAAVLDDLAWLGLEWEQPVRRQSEHFDDYREALDRLRQLGLVYPAFLSRNEIRTAAGAAAPLDPDGVPLYPGIDRDLPPAAAQRRINAGEPYAWRLKTAEASALIGPLGFVEKGERRSAEPQRWGDVILARKETPTSYHLSVVVDDALQGITDVIRGQDLFAATDIQRLLQALLGLPEPRYHHHRLILDDRGRKLSKSEGAPSLAHLREQGVTPEGTRKRLGF